VSRSRNILALAVAVVGCGGNGGSSAGGARPAEPAGGVIGAVADLLGGSAGPAGPPPPHPAGSVWIEPSVAGVGSTLRCLQDGAPAAAARWVVDGSDRATGPELAGPRAPGEVVRCAVGDVKSAAVVIHGDVMPQNVLFVLLDDVGVADVGAWGMKGAASTPRIDRLAAEGVRFERAWAEPVCSPTRASLLTGLHPMNHGLGTATAVDGKGAGLDDRFLSIADVVHQRGVPATGIFGKWHLGSGSMPDDHPARFGFDGYAIAPGNLGDQGEDYHRFEFIRNGARTNEEGYLPSMTVESALRFIKRQEGAWFAWVALNLAHAPYHQPPPDLAPHTGKDGLTDRYRSMVKAADTLIGRLLDGIPPEVLARTVVIVMGDNGTPEGVTRPPLNPEHAKSSVYEGGVRVPLVVWGPSVVGRGRVSETPVAAVDLLPTVAELLGRALDDAEAAQVDGRSFADALWSDHLPRDGRAIYAELFAPNTHQAALRRVHRRAITDERFKLVATPEGEELYDLREDPWERNNLLLRGAAPPPALERLRGLLRERFVQRPWPPPGWTAPE
jgi:arylsulfatase B